MALQEAVGAKTGHNLSAAKVWMCGESYTGWVLNTMFRPSLFPSLCHSFSFLYLVFTQYTEFLAQDRHNFPALTS